MALRIETFDNARGGNTLYKALTHPWAMRGAEKLLAELAGSGRVAIYDPGNAIEAFAQFFGIGGIDITGIFVQDASRIGQEVLGHAAQPVTRLAGGEVERVLVAAFDAGKLVEQLRAILPDGIEVTSFDAIRIQPYRLTNRRNYLDPLNFATNFAFFRDSDGLHTRLVTANYWAGYGAEAITCWMTLFDGAGEVIAEWCEGVGPGTTAIVLDSREIRARFRLPEFAGQLFIHVVGAAGHDIVKYALDIFEDAVDEDGVDKAAPTTLSCTHDANAWPSELYAGLPAPAAGERVILWIQNSHPTTIPAGAIGLNRMGTESVAAIGEAIPPFASRAIDIAELLPGLTWPAQIELRAGKHVVRPRYEILDNGRAAPGGAIRLGGPEKWRRRIAHMNVERQDLKPDPELKRLPPDLGKGYLLPAPILPAGAWKTIILPTPMSTAQADLPLALRLYDAAGQEVGRHFLGRLPRDHGTAIDLDEIAGPAGLAGLLSATGGTGHAELIYDFAQGGEGDGWAHAIFRYVDRRTGHSAESSFGAHIFNTLLTYRGEPQSYSGRPPGLSTRLFLRLGEATYDTLCHLIYPASHPWREGSTTEIILYDRAGREVTRSALSIPCSGSVLWRYHAAVDPAIRVKAGAGAYAIIRDSTCRLFGYHGLAARNGSFSLDHMFGF